MQDDGMCAEMHIHYPASSEQRKQKMKIMKMKILTMMEILRKSYNLYCNKISYVT